MTDSANSEHPPVDDDSLWLWDSCVFSEAGVQACGVRRLGFDQIGREFTISANGQMVEMIVVGVHSGDRWEAADVATWNRGYSDTSPTCTGGDARGEG